VDTANRTVGFQAQGSDFEVALPLEPIERVAGRHLLVDGVEAMRARDDRGARRRREAELDHAAHFQQLGRQQHVERAGIEDAR